MVETERAHIRLYILETWLWNGLWTCRKRDYVVMLKEDDAVLLDKTILKSILNVSCY